MKKSTARPRGFSSPEGPKLPDLRIRYRYHGSSTWSMDARRGSCARGMHPEDARVRKEFSGRMAQFGEALPRGPSFPFAKISGHKVRGTGFKKDRVDRVVVSPSDTRQMRHQYLPQQAL